MSRISPEERAAAHQRLATEELFPLDELTQEAGVSAESLLRWIARGRGGVHLDARMVCRVWHTSREALARFRAAVGAEGPG